MLRALRLAGGHVEAGGAELAGPAPASRPARAVAPDGAVLWVHASSPTEPELEWLGARFGFDALALEDSAHRGQRSKVDEFDGHLFVVFHALDARGSPTDLVAHEIHAYLGERVLVTVADAESPPVDSVWRRASADAALLSRGADFGLYAVCDAAVDSAFVVLDGLSDEIEGVEDAIVEGQTGPQQMTRIFALKGALVRARKAISPQREVFNFLSRIGEKWISPKSSMYFRDVHDHLTRIYEQIDTGRDLVGNALDAYLSMIAQRTNEQMKKLTVLSAVFLPITAVTGIFGMNLELLPIKGARPMAAACALLVMLPIAMFALVRKLRWF